MVNFTSFEVALITGFVTVTSTAPADAMAEAGMTAVNVVALTKEVGYTVPPKFTAEAVSKLAPLTVSVNAAPPATPLFGEIEVTDGAGADGSVKPLVPVASRPIHADDAARASVARTTLTLREDS
jgi:hypothetical protein